jgi:hypothetical protein
MYQFFVADDRSCRHTTLTEDPANQPASAEVDATDNDRRSRGQQHDDRRRVDLARDGQVTRRISLRTSDQEGAAAAPTIP